MTDQQANRKVKTWQRTAARRKPLGCIDLRHRKLRIEDYRQTVAFFDRWECAEDEDQAAFVGSNFVANLAQGIDHPADDLIGFNLLS
jgi:hypothetical protein